MEECPMHGWRGSVLDVCVGVVCLVQDGAPGMAGNQNLSSLELCSSLFFKKS